MVSFVLLMVFHVSKVAVNLLTFGTKRKCSDTENKCCQVIMDLFLYTDDVLGRSKLRYGQHILGMVWYFHKCNLLLLHLYDSNYSTKTIITCLT